MRSAFEAPEVDKIVVKLRDGSTWAAEYNSAGMLTPVREISPPEPEPEPTPPVFAEGSGKIAETVEKYIKGGTPRTPMAEALEGVKKAFGGRTAREKEIAEALPPMEDSVFRARLSNVMTDNMFDRQVRGRTRGKLDMKRLWKGHVGATNLFTQKRAHKNKRYNIVLLVDESGSMHGEKIDRAASVACFLAKTFDGLNLNLAIIGFNQFIHQHKMFDEKIPDLKKLDMVMRRNANAEHRGAGYNEDFDGLSFAYKQFNNREGQNFVIMLSDGEPAPSGYGDEVREDPSRLERAIKANHNWAITKPDELGKRSTFCPDLSSKLSDGERRQEHHLHHLVNSQTNITTIGIGLHTDCWQVPTNIREDNMDKLKPLLLREIQKKVKRG